MLTSIDPCLLTDYIVFFIITATGAKSELNLVLVMGAVGLSVLRTFIRFEPNSPQDILDKMHY